VAANSGYLRVLPGRCIAGFPDCGAESGAGPNCRQRPSGWRRRRPSYSAARPVEHRAYFAVTSIAVIGLYIAYVIRLPTAARRDTSRPGPWNWALGRPIAAVGVWGHHHVRYAPPLYRSTCPLLTTRRRVLVVLGFAGGWRAISARNGSPGRPTRQRRRVDRAGEPRPRSRPEEDSVAALYHTHPGHGIECIIITSLESAHRFLTHAASRSATVMLTKAHHRPRATRQAIRRSSPSQPGETVRMSHPSHPICGHLMFRTPHCREPVMRKAP